jgi:hypothetical protein
MRDIASILSQKEECLVCMHQVKMLSPVSSAPLSHCLAAGILGGDGPAFLRAARVMYDALCCDHRVCRCLADACFCMLPTAAQALL